MAYKNQPHPIILRYVKSVCHSWFGAVVLSRNSSAAFMTINADLAAPRGGSFSLEPGYYGYKVANQFPDRVRFFGRPFPEVYELVEASLAHIKPNKIVMCCDTLHTDILGAAVRGWRTVLVTRDGLFANNNTQVFSEKSNLFADWRLSRI